MSDEKKEKFAAANEAASCPNGQQYTIKPGDTLFLIAKRFNISLSSLLNCNPQITDPNVIYPGQVVVIPALGTVPATRVWPLPPEPMPGAPCGSGRGPRPPEPLPAATCPNGQIYRVVCGDTMFMIAQRFGISLDELEQANPQITDPNLIYPGQEICIPEVGGQPSCPAGMNYTVKAGDTLFDIARRNGVMLSDLIAANPQISDPDRIFPGQVVCIPAAPAMPPPPELPVQLPEPPPLPPEPPVELPPPVTPMPPLAAPMPCPYPAERPTPCPARPMPRHWPVARPRPLPPGRPQPPHPAPCQPMTGERPMMYPMPVYVVVPWDECPYRPKDRGKGKRRKRDRKHCGCK